MTADEIEESLRPSDDWWQADTPDIIANAAHQMLDAGMPAENVQEILRDVIGCIRGEYGE